MQRPAAVTRWNNPRSDRIPNERGDYDQRATLSQKTTQMSAHHAVLDRRVFELDEPNRRRVTPLSPASPECPPVLEAAMRYSGCGGKRLPSLRLRRGSGRGALATPRAFRLRCHGRALELIRPTRSVTRPSRMDDDRAADGKNTSSQVGIAILRGRAVTNLAIWHRAPRTGAWLSGNARIGCLHAAGARGWRRKRSCQAVGRFRALSTITAGNAARKTGGDSAAAVAAR